MKNLCVFLGLSLCLSLSLCYGMGGAPPEPDLMIDIPKDKDLPVLLPIRDVKRLDSLIGHKVIIVGEFRGWDDIGEPEPYSRNDWIIMDGSGAIFVHGPYPEGCDPLNKSTLGKPVKITGRVDAKTVSKFGVVRRVVYIFE